MLRLTSILFPLITITLSGDFLVVAATIGVASNFLLLSIALSGAVISAPLSWAIAAELNANSVNSSSIY